MAGPTVLTTRQRNRALLARQMLLARVRAPLPRIVERMGGIQAQYAPSAYIGLWSRAERFRRSDLTGALTRRSLIQGTLMRGTIHIVSRADYWAFAAGIRHSRREWWTRVARSRELDGIDYSAMAALLATKLAGGPCDRTGLIAATTTAGYPTEAWEGVAAWIDMVRVPPSGTWERRRADRYADATRWIGDDTASEGAGLELLLRRHLAAFGPSTLGDAARWAGVPVAAMLATAERIQLRRFRAEDDAELVDLPRARLPDPATPAPVRFLPTWDAILLAHARATGLLADEHRSLVFHTKNPQSVTTFLVDGAVAGTWRQEGERVVVDPFEPLPRPMRRQVAEEAERIAAFLA